MVQIVDPKSLSSQIAPQITTVPFFRLAFRPLFWLGALFGVISIGLWGLTYAGKLGFTPYGGSYFWHVHEMLFGFTVAIITGFLLTAVQNWTGVRSINGRPLAILVFTWVAARLLMMFPALAPDLLIAAIDIAYLPMAAYALAIPLVKAKLWRNLFFIPILLFMDLLNLLMHLASIEEIAVSFTAISHVMVTLIALVMCIMGGRVFPMFTANGTGTPRVPNIVWLDKFSIITVIASLIVSTQIIPLPATLEAAIYLSTGIVNFIRAFRWKIWVTFSTPLVWTLHLSYWSLCLGFILLGLEKIALMNQLSLAYHAITVGGISMMVLSMISRVSLGHSGRVIKVGKVMTFAFLMMVVAFLMRVVVPMVSAQSPHLILIAAAAWVIAYGTFVWLYAPIVFKPRTDGRDG